MGFVRCVIGGNCVIGNKALFIKEKHLELLKLLNSKTEKTFAIKYSDIAPLLAENAEIKAEEYSFLFSKLSIKNSFFGFVFFLKKGVFEEDEISLLNLSLNLEDFVLYLYSQFCFTVCLAYLQLLEVAYL